MQTESITTSNNKYTNKKINELKELINAQESKIFDTRLENNKIDQLLENKIEDINMKIKLIINTKVELNEKYDEEISIIFLMVISHLKYRKTVLRGIILLK